MGICRRLRREQRRFLYNTGVVENQQTTDMAAEAEEFLNRLKAVQEEHVKPQQVPGGSRWKRFVNGFLAGFRKRRAPHPDPSIRHLENQEELIKWIRIQSKFLSPLYSFYRGVFTGLGFVIGTTLVLSLLLAALGKLALVPIIGQFAKDILDYIAQTKGAV